MTDKRFPRSVYGTGEDPDARFSMANERTFLAWIRTSMALLAVGIAIEALAMDIDPVLRFIAAVIFIALSLLSAVNSWLTWRRTERAIRSGAALSGPSVGLLIVVGVVIAGTLLVAGLFL